MTQPGQAMGGAGFRSLSAMVWDYGRTFMASPAAGAFQTMVVPPNELWEIVGISFRLQTSAAAASRVVYLAFENTLPGTFEFLRVLPSAPQIANQTKDYFYSVGTVPIEHGTGGATWAMSQPIPPKLIMGSGDQITMAAYQLQITDQFQGFTVNYRKYRATTRVSLT